MNFKIRFVELKFSPTCNLDSPHDHVRNKRATAGIEHEVEDVYAVNVSQNATLTGLSMGAHTLTVYAQDTIGLVKASDTFSFVVADSTIPELPGILIVASAIVILSSSIVLVKARRGRRNADQNVFAFVH